MPLRHAYAPVFPEFDRFLFAAVGEEVDGVPLSVLSAISRLGLDPRDEAARLSHLTKEAAGDQFARMIARLSDRRWTASEARRIATTLIELLPMGTAAGTAHQIKGRADRKTGLRARLFLIYLALIGAALITLVVHGSLPLDGQGASPSAPLAGSERSAD